MQVTAIYRKSDVNPFKAGKESYITINAEISRDLSFDVAKQQASEAAPEGYIFVDFTGTAPATPAEQ